jgi:four helix bundle protein
MRSMQNPNKLAVSDRALDLAVAVYHLTDQFPASERFGLSAQMRRAAVSIGSNVAEGCGRWGRRELVQFLQVSYSSAAELAFQLTIASELDYGKPADRVVVAELTDHVQRMLNRLMAAKRKALMSRREAATSHVATRDA